MLENNPKDKIDELKSELQSKNKEITNLLDKIENLEDTIMELEAILSRKSNDRNDALLKLQTKDLEKKNRELKDKMGFLRLENVRLKQELEKIKKKSSPSYSLIQVIDKSSLSNGSNLFLTKERKINEDEINQVDLFEDILVRCPECNIQKFLEVPAKILTGSKNVTISIPAGIICKHAFQTFVDQFSAVRGYHVIDVESTKLEYYETIVPEEEQNEKDDLSNFASLPLFQEIINILRGCVDDREILGSAILAFKGKVLYSSIPHRILFNMIREFEVRSEKKLNSIINMFLEFKNHQKVCLEYIEIHNIEFIFILIFSASVNFAIGNMYLRDISKKIKELI